jgi:GDPmannose 4,6-dehydratase
MLQQEQPDDYVVATGESYSVAQFLDEVFNRLNLDWHDFVKIDPRFYRPAEVDYLLGDPSKAMKKLGWKPKITFKELARIMTEYDLDLAQREAHAASFSVN